MPVAACSPVPRTASRPPAWAPCESASPSSCLTGPSHQYHRRYCLQRTRPPVSIIEACTGTSGDPESRRSSLDCPRRTVDRTCLCEIRRYSTTRRVSCAHEPMEKRHSRAGDDHPDRRIGVRPPRRRGMADHSRRSGGAAHAGAAEYGRRRPLQPFRSDFRSRPPSRCCSTKTSTTTSAT